FIIVYCFIPHPVPSQYSRWFLAPILLPPFPPLPSLPLYPIAYYLSSMSHNGVDPGLFQKVILKMAMSLTESQMVGLLTSLFLSTTMMDDHAVRRGKEHTHTHAHHHTDSPLKV